MEKLDWMNLTVYNSKRISCTNIKKFKELLKRHENNKAKLRILGPTQAIQMCMSKSLTEDIPIH